MFRAAMPETAINEDGDPCLCKHEVRFASQSLERARVNAVPKTKFVQRRTDREFGTCVPRPLTGHSLACRVVGQEVLSRHSS
jgi:hypothetical protein